MRRLLMLGVVGLLAACATPPSGDPEATAEFKAANDPFEPNNRLIFSFNVMVDNLVLQPVAVAYRDLAPDELKPPIRNLLRNLTLPLTFVHGMLQGNFDRAGRAAGRFAANTPTLWLGDLAPGEEDPDFFREDAGQTLAVWGLDPGPYVMLPLIGPSNLRDAIGTVIDFFADPVNVATDKEFLIGVTTSTAVEERSRNVEQVRDLQRISLDYYAAVRSLYRQRRATEIKDGDIEPTQPAPTIAIGPVGGPAAEKTEARSDEPEFDPAS